MWLGVVAWGVGTPPPPCTVILSTTSSLVLISVTGHFEHKEPSNEGHFFQWHLLFYSTYRAAGASDAMVAKSKRLLGVFLLNLESSMCVLQHGSGSKGLKEVK